MADVFNLYGDSAIPSTDGRGVDIASQRVDDLDVASISMIQQVHRHKRRRPVVFDLGCGSGAHAIRMAEAGAHVIAIDIEDNRGAVLDAAATAGVVPFVNFIRQDVRCGFSSLQPPDIVYSQRTIHYLRHAEALRLILGLAASQQNHNGSVSFFLSVSGLDSELSVEYADAARPVSERFCFLSPTMQQKHLITNPVCLYSADDMYDLLLAAGLVPARVYLSPFGNVKAIATRG